MDGQEPNTPETGGQEPQPTPDADTGPAPTTPQAGGDDAQPQGIDALPDWAQKEIRELRKESAARRKAQREAEEAQRQAQEEQLAQQQEWQKLAEQRQARIAELESQYNEAQATMRQQRVNGALRSAAQSAGFANVEDVLVFIQPDDVDLSDDGDPTNADALVQALAKERPYLLAAPDPAPGQGKTPKPAGIGRRDNERARQEALADVSRRF